MQNVICYWHRPKSTGPATLWIINFFGRLLTTSQTDKLPGVGQTLKLIKHGCVLVSEVTCRDYGEFLAWQERRQIEKVNNQMALRNKGLSLRSAGVEFGESRACVFTFTPPRHGKTEEAKRAEELHRQLQACYGWTNYQIAIAAEIGDSEAKFRADVGAAVIEKKDKQIAELNLRIESMRAAARLDVIVWLDREVAQQRKEIKDLADVVVTKDKALWAKEKETKDLVAEHRKQVDAIRRLSNEIFSLQRENQQLTATNLAQSGRISSLEDALEHTKGSY
jgi:hypothetical protein